MTLFTPPADPPKRLSVSAMRDYNRCPHYFKLARIDKVPEDKVTHHRWAGSLIHSAFMLAYGTPKPPAPGTPAFRTDWDVDNAGTIEDCEEFFEMLWEGEFIYTGQEEVIGKTRAQLAYEAVKHDAQLIPPDARSFAPGRVKALKQPNFYERKLAWKDYFKTMLRSSLETGLAYPVVAMEQEVHYQLGGVDQLGYVDLVLQKPNGKLIVADLKSGQTLPGDRQIAFDEQMNAYYTAPVLDQLPEEVWYVHMKSGTILKVPKNLPMIKALNEAAPQIMQNIQEGRFTKKVSADCATCSRRLTCMGV